VGIAFVIAVYVNVIHYSFITWIVKLFCFRFATCFVLQKTRSAPRNPGETVRTTGAGAPTGNYSWRIGDTLPGVC
jgi:hypothetical protein